MKHLLLLNILIYSFANHSFSQVIELKNGLKIHSSVKIKKDFYLLDAGKDLQAPVIEIEGNDIVVDFNDATIKGSNDKQMPDEFYGLAVLIKSGKNITIKNLNIRSFKVALMARNVQGLIIEHCNFSYNYRQHLNSTQQKEDVSDWMSYHHNENDEWLRYGAAMYLRGCNNAVINNNLVNGGQCALMMTDCNDAMIYNNDFSFNSGIGIGLYKSSRNKIMHNKLDWNVRGFSYEVYYRGQDSAAILVFEQCNENVFAYNSATHSGDGFFLWAGQTTMDTGKGGCNDNLLYKNDFSYAPTNGVELTFSRNKIIRNKIEECDNGIWGGYSYNTLIRKNEIIGNKTAIAIEQGQDNKILSNTFRDNNTSIKLWARKDQPKDWGYAQNRDVRSMRYEIADNVFNHEHLVNDISNTSDLVGRNNYYKNCDSLFRQDTTISNAYMTDVPVLIRETEDDINLPEIKNAQDAFLSKSHPKGKKEMRITEWGPYDYKYPMIWNTNPQSQSDTLQFDILGPKGKWKMIDAKGIKNISIKEGVVPSKIIVITNKAEKSGVVLEMGFIGDEITTQFGEKIKAGTPYRFNYKESFVPISWSVNWFAFDSASDPVESAEKMKALVEKQSLKQETTADLHYAWWGGIKESGKVYSPFLTTATGKVEVEEGKYELNVTWNDVVRIYVDDLLAIDEWKPVKFLFDESPHKRVKLNLSAGQHIIRVEQAASGGFASLVVNLKRL
ncbi:MAG TPA: right-handed parallel beta-helix repeat-containing protein [Puia sp.]|nr:right-handed parallel beta-helix repeat-containing protein [Puia sp.]